MVRVVVRLTLRGVPPILNQDKVKNKGQIESVRHTVKAERLIRYEICKYLFFYL